MFRSFPAIALAALLAFAAAVPAAHAAEVETSEEFALDTWYDLDATDGGVTLHRIRLERKEGRVTKSAVFRPHNQEYLDTLAVQLEYTNESDRKWSARVTVRWLDEEGRLIDGLSANETLSKKSARKMIATSVSTLKYGVERAKTLEIEVHFEP